jgi:hypothetical protein
MNKIELVFRTIGERTTEIALELAIKNIDPDKIHIIENIKPFSKAMEKILSIEYDKDTDFVIFVDADCLILQNLRPFLDSNDYPYVDCYVLDKFRGFVHMGVHITRIDVVNAMKKVHMEKTDPFYILKPESAIRNVALATLNFRKTFKRFRILHDFLQFYEHLFIKYALRELRSRDDYSKAKLHVAMQEWKFDDKDFSVVYDAIQFTRKHVKLTWTEDDISQFIISLPIIAKEQIKKLSIQEKRVLKEEIVFDLKEAIKITGQFDFYNNPKIFCIGLSRTSTKSLTAALNVLGINVIHYPVDDLLFEEITSGNYNFSILKDYDGISDITVSPYYAQLEKLFPDSKFILTIRDKKSWLESLKKHWDDRPPFDDPDVDEIHLKIRRFLRASVYGLYTYDENRLSYVYDLHYRNVVEYFKDKTGKLLILNINAGEGWEKLCHFLAKPIPVSLFPHINQEEQLLELL